MALVQLMVKGSMSSGDFQSSASSSLWEAIGRIAEEEGVLLFDMDLPGGGGSAPGGILRVYITHSKTSAQPAAEPPTETDEQSSVLRGGVSFEDCVRVSKRILDVDEQSGLIPEGCLLEVSSPGVNRRLRRLEHFEGAVGERVRVKFRDADGSYRVVTGSLEAVVGETLTVQVEDQPELITCNVRDVKEARVDFRF